MKINTDKYIKSKISDTLGKYDIALITSDSLRHRRFALKIQNKFKEKVVLWIQIEKNNQLAVKSIKFRFIEKAIKFSYSCFQFLPKILIPKKIYTKVNYAYCDIVLESIYIKSEFDLINHEIQKLEKDYCLNPIIVKDPNSDSTIELMRKFNPFFIVSLGGPLYSKKIIECARGLALNQHAGHSPNLKGSYTTEWALLHRNLKWISSTIHITNSAVDSGDILRQSSPCMLASDNFGKIFNRVVILGTELLIETIDCIIKNEEVTLYKQENTETKTYLSKDFNRIKYRLFEDFSNKTYMNEILSNTKF